MFKYTPNTLKRIEDIFTANGYSVRYERGNFNTGYCIIHEKKVVVVNKFFGIEGKINSLLEVLDQVNIDESILSKQSLVICKIVQKEVVTS